MLVVYYIFLFPFLWWICKWQYIVMCLHLNCSFMFNSLDIYDCVSCVWNVIRKHETHCKQIIKILLYNMRIYFQHITIIYKHVSLVMCLLLFMLGFYNVSVFRSCMPTMNYGLICGSLVTKTMCGNCMSF